MIQVVEPFSATRPPVQDHSDRRRRVFLHSGDKKLPAVRGDHVLVADIALLHGAADGEREERDGRTDLGRIRRQLDRDRHQPAIPRDVKEFLPVAPPTHLRATADGNGNPVSRARERPNIDFGNA